MVADDRTLCQNCSNREGRTVFLEGARYECTSKACGFAKGPERKADPEKKRRPQKRKALAHTETKARKRQNHAREEEEEEDDEDVSMASSDQDSQESDEDPWQIMEILQERWVISNTSPTLTRQYVLRYLQRSLTGHAKFRDADQQDKIDMPPEVLEQWRTEHPFDSIPVTHASKTTRLEVKDKANTEIANRVAAYSKNNLQSSSSIAFSAAAVPVPQAPSQQPAGIIALDVPVQRTHSQKVRAWEHENRKTDLDSSNILMSSRRSGT
jgi:hypothetical protein